MILVGNKCDLETKREVETSVGRETAKNWGIPFLETSAKKDINIQVCTTFCATVRQSARKIDSLPNFENFFLALSTHLDAQTSQLHHHSHLA